MTTTADRPHDHGDRWDEADVRWLKRLLRTKGNTYAEMGEVLGRTAEACRAKARRLGLR